MQLVEARYKFVYIKNKTKQTDKQKTPTKLNNGLLHQAQESHLGTAAAQIVSLSFLKQC